MRAYDLFEKYKKYGDISFQEGIKQTYYRQAMCEDYDDSLLDLYMKDQHDGLISSPKTGNFAITVLTMNFAKQPQMKIVKQHINKKTEQYFSNTNMKVGDYHNVGTLYFDTEENADHFIVLLKISFDGSYNFKQEIL